ncbi:MAG TPA: protein kinase, partial [Polyangiaceae bacterium]
LAITAAILDGLSAAHEIGIVHRDIKPPNVILVAGDRPKILDFGVAKIADDPGVVTARGVAVGTPRYMSPEQARGERVDGRADIYSCGLLLFEMISGVGPFDDSRDPNELILAHIARLAPPLSSLVMGVPAELDAVVASMLHKQLERRPETARRAAEILRSVLARVAEAAGGPGAGGGDVRANDAGVPSKTARSRPDETTRPEASVHASGTTRTSVSPPPWSGETARPDATTFAAAPAFSPSGVDAASLSSLGAVVTSVGHTLADSAVAVPHDSTGRSPLPAVEAVRTEMLTGVPSPEPGVTRTRVPKLDRPPSVTPPPVSAGGGAAASRRSRGRDVQLALLGLGMLGLSFGVTAFVLQRREPSAESVVPKAAGLAVEGTADARLPAAPALPADPETRNLAPASLIHAPRGKDVLPAPTAAPARSSVEPLGAAPRPSASSASGRRKKRSAVPEAEKALDFELKSRAEGSAAAPLPRARVPASPARTAPSIATTNERRPPSDGALPGSGL